MLNRRLRLHRSNVLAVSGLLAVAAVAVSGCNGGSSEGPMAGMDGAVSGQDSGSVPRGGACGFAAEACCAGRACEVGLGCSASHICCIQAGGGGHCDSASDCCRGLACRGGACCAPRTAACGGSNDCCAGLVCAGGICQSRADVGGPDGCGVLGAECCADETCVAGAVCRTGMCAACGEEDQPCCDGATACVGSLACDLTSRTCLSVEGAGACGELGNACCAPPGGGEPSECSGGFVCEGGICVLPVEVGGDGQPCGPRGRCGPGLVCDRSSDATGVCTTPPGGCGRNGEACCSLGDGEGECGGLLGCDSGSCVECRGASSSCASGEDCCDGTVCRPSPSLMRCCRGAGGACENSLDCCGMMRCGAGGTCQCGGEDSFCLDSSECCSGLTCEEFQCRPAGPVCADAGTTTCEESSQCCGGLACSEVRPTPTAAPVRQCCAGGATACEEDGECCGRMECEGGECQCVPKDGLCDRDLECCQSDGHEFICVAGACASGTGCVRPGGTCNVGTDCCGGLRCDSPLIDRDRRCCAQVDARCLEDSDCCGGSTCSENETCQCVPAGGTCETRLDCCTGATCAPTGSGAFECCVPEGNSCASDTDCCGDLTCDPSTNRCASA